MKLVKDILARFIALWGIISFILTFLIILIPSLITALFPNPQGMVWFNLLSRLWMNVWLTLIGCRVKVTGTKNFEQGKNYIVTCNHNALMDVPLSAPFTPAPNKTIAKDSFTKIPLFGWYYRRGSVLVNRKDAESRKKSYELMKAALSKGFNMCIYPEGSRNRTNNPLNNFHDGAFRLAVDTRKPIIPTLIFGTKKTMPVNKVFYLWPQTLEIHFLKPVEPENLSITELKEKVFIIMWNYYQQHAKETGKQ
ncbi:MAG TPA: 1-acyl-sn-glycerol-3-phosphate acyltransferase [Chitinophagaceae bacterium]|nr:1-acyl-sn-glycerol-3-phosphate acyltransferase [Chitinophagaceae bacterium]